MRSYNKTCRQCLMNKPVEEFQPKVYASGRRGWRHICTACKNENGRRENLIPERNEARRAAKLKHRYNISIAEYDELAAYQDHVCAICLEVCNTGQPLSVDHCHETNMVRGLLCRRCNVAVGTLKSVELLERAIEYLAGTRTVRVV